ncbi:MAG TPA: phosphoribosyltransferase family protein [Methanomicrobiales archaeon]|jgi:predicted phosphoribosyltransferase|nr:phosphoribosyltransferase family protein [Methanomicrobiales archaeon]
MGELHEDPVLRDRAPVFRDRKDAGERLGRYLAGLLGLGDPAQTGPSTLWAIPDSDGIRDPLVCPIPAGGIPVGIAVADALRCPLFPLVVRKVQIPWNTEAGFGAVAWDGSMILNEDLLERLRLTPEQVDAAIGKARANVGERMSHFEAAGPFPDPAGRSCIIVDDGLASGFTMTAAAIALRQFRPRKILVAVPTGSLAAVERVAGSVDEVVCLNVRTGYPFAVADAYEEWYDLTEEDAIRLLREVGPADPGKGKGGR